MTEPADSPVAPAVATDPTFTTRAELVAWARQRWRFPDPAPDARTRALDDIRRVTLAHVHLGDG